MSKKASLPRTWSIVDGMKSPEGQPYFLFAANDGEVWFSSRELLSSEVDLRTRIAEQTGITIASPQAMAALRTQVEEFSNFRAGVIATHAGWLDRLFVCGDGRVLPEGSTIDVCAFERLAKFTPSGSLEDWQNAMDPFVRGHPLPFFVCALALTGPILRFMPAGSVNPQVELVGQAKSGKSTLGTLAASVWAGESGKTEGGGENWNMTPNAYDGRRLDHQDTFILLDEAEGAETNPAHRRALAKKVIFTGAATGSKRRQPDSTIPPPLHVPVLSTTNTRLRDVLRGEGKEVVEAAVSRMMSIDVARDADGAGIPIFRSPPKGTSTVAEGVRDLRQAVDNFYGTAGPAFADFVAKAVKEDEAGFRAKMATDVKSTRLRLESIGPGGDERHRDMLAVVEFAANLAQEAGVLDARWADPSGIIDHIYHVLVNALLASSFRGINTRLNAYVQRERAKHRFRDINCVILPAPYVRKSYPGFIQKNPTGGEELLVDPAYFARTFNEASTFLIEARISGQLRTHRSESDRLQIHAPPQLKKYGFIRVHAIALLPD